MTIPTLSLSLSEGHTIFAMPCQAHLSLDDMKVREISLQMERQLGTDSLVWEVDKKEEEDWMMPVCSLNRGKWEDGEEGGETNGNIA